MKKKLKFGILSFISGAIIFGGIGTVLAYTMLAKDISYTPENENFNVTNVKEALDELYSYASDLQFHSASSTYDTTQAKVSYVAENNIKALVTGVGESIYSRGTSNFVLNTDGISHVLVNNKCTYPASSAYSCLYAYVVELKKGQTLEAYTYSNQGHTNNTTVLYLFN